MDEVGNTRRKKNQDSLSTCASILTGGKEKSLYHKDLRHLLQTKDKCSNPRKAFRKDLVKYLTKWRQEG